MTPLLLTACMLLQTAAGPTYQGKPREPHPLAPSLPILTEKEQKAYEDIVDRFIQQDIGKLKGEAAAKAVEDFKALGPEATFALLAGLNRAANMENSCPAVLIAKKLSLIIAGTKDALLLDFLRENIGGGVSAKRHTVTLKDLKLACSLRKSTLQRAEIAANKQGGKDKSPKSLTIPELAAAANKATGEALKNVLIELSTRKGDQVVPVLGSAVVKGEKEIQPFAAVLLEEALGNQSAADLKYWLAKGSPEVRAAAARVIGDKGFRQIDALIAALADPEEAVRQAARGALVKLASNMADHGPQIGAGPSERTAAQEQWRLFWQRKT